MNWLPGILAAAALVTAAPGLAQTAEEDYQAGVAARLAGDPAGALRRLERAAAAEPDNADIHLQIGLAWLALDRLDEAEAALNRTLALAPDYPDARIALARLAERRGDRAAARAELDRLPTPNAEADALRRRLEASAEPLSWRWRVDADAGWSAVENSPDWREAALALRHRPDPAMTLGVALEAAERFDRTDVYGEARIDHRFAPGASLYLLAGGTPDADFRPEWQVGAGGAFRLRGDGDATVLRLDARHAEYPLGPVQILTPGIEQYFAGGEGWLTGQWINVFDGDVHSAGWLARADWMASPRARIFAGLSDAPDLTEGIVTDVFAIFGGLAWDVSDRLALRFGLAHEDRAGGADRLSLTAGTGLRF